VRYPLKSKDQFFIECTLSLPMMDGAYLDRQHWDYNGFPFPISFGGKIDWVFGSPQSDSPGTLRFITGRGTRVNEHAEDPKIQLILPTHGRLTLHGRYLGIDPGRFNEVATGRALLQKIDDGQNDESMSRATMLMQESAKMINDPAECQRIERIWTVTQRHTAG
jgi:hypothetical protein